MNTRTKRMAVTVVALAAVVTPAAFSRPAAVAAPPPIPPALPRPSGYDFRAYLVFQMHQRWTEALGSKTKPCDRWYTASGESNVDILSKDFIGHFSPTAIPRSLQWASLFGGGEMESSRDVTAAARTLEEDRGVNWSATCPDGQVHSPPIPPPKPYPIETNPDCDRSLAFADERALHGRVEITTTRLKSTATLQDIELSPLNGQRAIQFSGRPRRSEWHRRCRVSDLGLDLPLFIAFPVEDADLRALRRLAAGKNYVYKGAHTWTQCAPADETPQGATCRFRALLRIRFHRLTAAEAARIR